MSVIYSGMTKDSGQIKRIRHTKPSVITDTVVHKLAMHLSNGWSVETSCAMLGISRSAYYDHLKLYPDRAELFDLMKRMPTEQAIKNITEAIYEKDLKVSMWFLERMYPEQFGSPRAIKNNSVFNSKTGVNNVL